MATKKTTTKTKALTTETVQPVPPEPPPAPEPNPATDPNATAEERLDALEKQQQEQQG